MALRLEIYKIIVPLKLELNGWKQSVLTPTFPSPSVCMRVYESYFALWPGHSHRPFLASSTGPFPCTWRIALVLYASQHSWITGFAGFCWTVLAKIEVSASRPKRTFVKHMLQSTGFQRVVSAVMAQTAIHSCVQHGRKLWSLPTTQCEWSTANDWTTTFFAESH